MRTTRSVTVGRTADIKPGELAAFDVEGVRVAVANANGRFFAIDDTCTHEQCSLAAEGTLDGTVVTCGCHGAQFDVTTGAVIAPPALEPVKAYPLRIDQGNIVLSVASMSADGVNDAQIASIVVTANQVDIDAGQLAASLSTK
jgi:3-phenylpropionate/trans-cinnamate dioxygenase ferredoxin subunit